MKTLRKTMEVSTAPNKVSKIEPGALSIHDVHLNFA